MYHTAKPLTRRQLRSTHEYTIDTPIARIVGAFNAEIGFFRQYVTITPDNMTATFGGVRLAVKSITIKTFNSYATLIADNGHRITAWLEDCRDWREE